MKVFLFLLSISMLACSIPKKEPRAKSDQERFHAFLDSLDEEYMSTGNEALKKDKVSIFQKRVDSFLTSTLHGVLVRFNVEPTSIRHIPWNNEEALIFTGNDDKVEYWMEAHFKNEDSMMNSQMYKHVTKFSERRTDTMSFIYLPKVEVDPDFGLRFKVEVLLVPDSIAVKFGSKDKHKD